MLLTEAFKPSAVGRVCMPQMDSSIYNMRIKCTPITYTSSASWLSSCLVDNCAGHPFKGQQSKSISLEHVCARSLFQLHMFYNIPAIRQLSVLKLLRDANLESKIRSIKVRDTYWVTHFTVAQKSI